MTLADHAEAYHSEQGKTMPPRDAPEWQMMYEEWIDFAFAEAPNVSLHEHEKPRR